MTVLASLSDDILHIGYMISYYRCKVIVLVHDRFYYWSLSCQNYKTLEKYLNFWS